MGYQFLLLFLFVTDITATTPTAFPTGSTFGPLSRCNITTSILDDASLCSGRADGNYPLIVGGETFPENFVSCIADEPYCRFCQDPNVDTILHYSEVCNQCLSPTDAAANNCFSTPTDGPSRPAPDCPTNSTANDEQCSEQGPDFFGNRVDYRMNPFNSPKPIFLMCSYGKYVDCMECQHKLLFRELVNFDGDPDIYGHCA